MLVLTRRAGESIVIGDDVRVVVLDVRGDTVRLGIEAPRSIQVHRSEVYAEVQAANAAAATPAADFDGAAERLRRIARGGVPRQAGRRPAAGPATSPAPAVPAPAVPAPAAPGQPGPSERPKPGPPPIPRPGPPPGH